MGKVDQNWVPCTNLFSTPYTGGSSSNLLKCPKPSTSQTQKFLPSFVSLLDWINCMVYTMLRRVTKIYSSMPSFPSDVSCMIPKLSKKMKRCNSTTITLCGMPKIAAGIRKNTISQKVRNTLS